MAVCVALVSVALVIENFEHVGIGQVGRNVSANGEHFLPLIDDGTFAAMSCALCYRIEKTIRIEAFRVLDVLPERALHLKPRECKHLIGWFLAGPSNPNPKTTI